VKRRHLGVIALVALTASSLGACAPIGDTEPITGGPAEAVENPAAGLPGTAKSSTAEADLPSTTLGFELPVPEPLPLDAYEPTPEETVGSIAIPSLGVDEALHVGMTLTAINRGPSMWPGTALPGQVGNIVVAGHRTTYGGPFRNVDQLAEGDPVTFTTAEGTFTYEVMGTRIVDPEALDIASQSNYFTATLFACHPPGSAASRIVVDLQLVDESGTPVPPAT